MSALINLNDGRIARYLKLSLVDSAETIRLSGQGIGLKGGVIESLVGKDKEKEETISQTILMPNTTVRIVFGKISPVKYETLVSVHPKLHDVAIVSHTHLYPPGQEYELAVTLKPFKKLELSELTWLLSVFVID